MNQTIPYHKETFPFKSGASVTISVKDEYGDKNGSRHGTIISTVRLANGEEDMTRGFFTLDAKNMLGISDSRNWRELTAQERKLATECIAKIYQGVDRTALPMV